MCPPHYHLIILHFVSFLGLADGILLETEWQQISSSLQDSSEYPSIS